MIEKPESEELFTMYLLGELPEDDRTRLEEVLFANEDYYEQLLVAEDELRYDYAQGLLDPKRRERFEKRFAVSPGDREMLEFAAALISTLSTRPVAPPPVTVELTGTSPTAVEPRQHEVGPWHRLPSITSLVARSTSTVPSTSLPDSWRERLQPRDRLARITRLIPRLRVEKVEEPEFEPAANHQVELPKPVPGAERLEAGDVAVGEPVAERPDADQLVAELLEQRRLEQEPPVTSSLQVSPWGRLARGGLALIAIVLIAGVGVIALQTIRYQNLVKELRRELSLQSGFRAQTEEEKRRARELALDLEVERNRRLMLENEGARHPKQPVEKVEAVPAAASFIISPGMNRDSGAMKKPLIQPGDAERVRLQLNLKRPGDYQTYEAKLKTAEGTVIWGEAGLRPSRFGPIQVIAVTLLARVVPPGDYHVELKGLALGGLAEQVDDYYFSVANR